MVSLYVSLSVLPKPNWIFYSFRHYCVSLLLLIIKHQTVWVTSSQWVLYQFLFERKRTKEEKVACVKNEIARGKTKKWLQWKAKLQHGSNFKFLCAFSSVIPKPIKFTHLLLRTYRQPATSSDKTWHCLCDSCDCFPTRVPKPFFYKVKKKGE